MPFAFRRLWKSKLFACSLLALFALTALGVSRGVWLRTSQSPSAHILGAAAPAETKPKDVDVLVPDGMPLSFAASTEEDNEKGHEIKATLANKHLNKINSLTYATYEFDPAGNLVRVEGGIKRIDLDAGRQATLSIIPQRRSNPKNRLMLALEKATGDKESWVSVSP